MAETKRIYELSPVEALIGTESIAVDSVAGGTKQIRADILFGNKKELDLRELVWEPGRINTSGNNFDNGSEYAYRTANTTYFETEDATLFFVDDNNAGLEFDVFAYDKETGTFVSDSKTTYLELSGHAFRIDPQYKYRFVIWDSTSTVTPDYEKIHLYVGNPGGQAGIAARVAAVEKKASGHAIRVPRITFMDANGSMDFKTYVKPIYEDHNVPYCVAYNATQNPYVPPSSKLAFWDLQDIAAEGNEILARSKSDLTAMQPAALAADLEGAKTILQEIGCKVNGIVYSGGKSNEAVRAEVAKRYGFGVKSEDSNNAYRSNKDLVGAYYLNVCLAGGAYDRQKGDFVNVNTWEIGYFQTIIDECVSQNGWLILMTDASKMYNNKQEAYREVDQLQLLDDILTYIETVQQTHPELQVVTASEAFEIFGNAWQAGDYLGSYYNSRIQHVLGSAAAKTGLCDINGGGA